MDCLKSHLSSLHLSSAIFAASPMASTTPPPQHLWSEMLCLILKFDGLNSYMGLHSLLFCCDFLTFLILVKFLHGSPLITGCTFSLDCTVSLNTSVFASNSICIFKICLQLITGQYHYIEFVQFFLHSFVLISC